MTASNWPWNTLEDNGVIARAELHLLRAIAALRNSARRSHGPPRRGYVFVSPARTTESAVEGHGLYFQLWRGAFGSWTLHIAIAQELVRPCWQAVGLEPPLGRQDSTTGSASCSTGNAAGVDDVPMPLKPLVRF